MTASEQRALSRALPRHSSRRRSYALQAFRRFPPKQKESPRTYKSSRRSDLNSRFTSPNNLVSGNPGSLLDSSARLLGLRTLSPTLSLTHTLLRNRMLLGMMCACVVQTTTCSAPRTHERPLSMTATACRWRALASLAMSFTYAKRWRRHSADEGALEACLTLLCRERRAWTLVFALFIRFLKLTGADDVFF